MSCIGTAGHIDHGKSALVEALTGIDPDRLREEKVRGMTIDLGFAWLTLPGGRSVSVVDVPGHEGFIKNMLAGVGGIDAALLVVAADEGVMPQTREHLAILDLLHIDRGVVALTKVDLVDQEWLDLVRDEVVELLQATCLAGARIVPVSAYTRQGIEDLLAELERILASGTERLDRSHPRLPVDRVFTMTGFGTVVTGTLLDGSLRVGQEVEVLPAGQRTRIRTLQMHRQAIEQVSPGNRVAINLASLARSEIERGNVVALPGDYRPTLLLDARIRLLADAARPLAHNTQVDFYCGAQEIPARVRLLDREQVEPGQQALAQLRFTRPAIVARGDAFILRIPSPGSTIGGGKIIDVHPRYHRRQQPAVLERLEMLEHGAPDEIILELLERRESSSQKNSASTLSSIRGGAESPRRSADSLIGYELTELAKQSNLSQDVIISTLETLLQEERIRKIGVWWFAQSVWNALCQQTIYLLSEHHHRYPLRSGLSKEEWRVRLGLSPRMVADIFLTLQKEGILAEVASNARMPRTSGGLIRLPDFVPIFTNEQQKQVDDLLRMFRAHPYTPPGHEEIESIVGSEVLGAMLERGNLVKIGHPGDPVLFLRETYDEAITRLLVYLREHKTMTVAEARDLLGTTRKYLLPLLEHMDERRITRRLGDQRILGNVPTSLLDT